jgi:hypothetical protein
LHSSLPLDCQLNSSANLLALGQGVEQGEELGEGDGGGFGALDLCVAFSAEGGDGEGHGDAVVGAGVDGCAVQFLVAGDLEAVGILGELGSHDAEILGDEGDAVGLLDAQLLSVADDEAVGGVGGDGGKHGQLIDDLRGERAADDEGLRGGCGCDTVYLQAADQFAVLLFDGEDLDAAAEGGDDVEQRGAGGVHAEGVEDEVGVGEEQRGAEEECGGRDVAGYGGVDGCEALAAEDGEFGGLVRAARGGAGEGCAEGLERVLGVVAGEDGFGEAGGAFGLQAGEEDGGFDLRGGDGRGEVDGAERAAVDGNGRVAFDEVEAAAHLGEGFADALHGAQGERVVADEGEGVRMRCDEASEHTHGGAGVAAVEWSGGLAEVASDAGNLDGTVGIADDSCAEGFHAGERGVWIGSGGEVGETRGAFGEAGEHGVTVRDGLVAWDGEGALEAASGTDDLGGHSSSSVAEVEVVSLAEWLAEVALLFASLDKVER